jgi:hypothetical protein
MDVLLLVKACKKAFLKAIAIAGPARDDARLNNPFRLLSSSCFASKIHVGETRLPLTAAWQRGKLSHLQLQAS